VHIIIAAGLLYWGIKLLININQNHKVNNQKEILLLILPCPICLTVIFFTLSLSYETFSFNKIFTTNMLFIFFSSFSLLTIFLTIPFRKKISNSIPEFLGLTMIIIAVYFFLLIIIAPVYQEVKEVYKIIFNKTIDNILNFKSLVILLITTISLFIIGMIIRLKN
jgi:predicted transporter